MDGSSSASCGHIEEARVPDDMYTGIYAQPYLTLSLVPSSSSFSRTYAFRCVGYSTKFDGLLARPHQTPCQFTSTNISSTHILRTQFLARACRLIKLFAVCKLPFRSLLSRKQASGCARRIFRTAPIALALLLPIHARFRLDPRHRSSPPRPQ